MAQNKVLEILNKFIEIYASIGDDGRVKAFTNAKRAILENRKVTNHIGKIIDEIKATGKCEALETLLKDPTVKSYMELTSVMGIGPAAAKKLIAQNIRDLAALRRAFVKGEVKLTHMQKLGLAHYVDLKKRIPRAEVEQIYNNIMKIIKEAAPNISSIVLGSYRRGAATSGDVDILLHGEGNMSKIAIAIEESPYAIATLAKGTQKISLLWGSGNVVRHVDIFYAKKRQLIPYLLYGTGSAEHNELMRGIAKKHGYKLNQLGLYRQDGSQKILNSEQELYDLLGVPYVEPQNRN